MSTALPDGVLVDLEHGLAVLQRIGLAHCVVRELAGLAHRCEADPER